MTRAGLIVCEKTHRWAIALRSALGAHVEPGRCLEIVEARSLSQVEAAWRKAPYSAVAIETTAANLAAVVELFARVSPETHAVCVSLLDRQLATAAPLLREAGAVAVLTSALEAPAAGRLIARHLDRAPPAIEADYRTAVQARLPWPRTANSH